MKLFYNELHDAANVGAGRVMRNEQGARLFALSASAISTAGTINAVVKLYGSADGIDWHEVATVTFTGAANGEKATPQSLEMGWQYFKSECVSISGTGAKVRLGLSGA